MTDVLPRHMQVWLFQFTENPRPVASVRVAAWDRNTAVQLLSEKLGLLLDAAPFHHPAPGCILSCIGRNDAITEPRIMQFVTLEGKLEVSGT